MSHDSSRKMAEDWRHISESILDLALKIIHMLTEEDYEVVKKINRIQSHTSIMCPLTYRMPVSSNKQKILEVTSKIIELLTKEVPIRCQDVTVFLSMEEWEYLEGHKDLYKSTLLGDPHLDTVMEDQARVTSLGMKLSFPVEEKRNVEKDHLLDTVMKDQALVTSADGIIVGNPPERSPQSSHSEDSTLEDQKIPHHHKVIKEMKIKEANEESEEADVRGEEHYMEEETSPELHMGTSQGGHHDQIGDDLRIKEEVKEESEEARCDELHMEEEASPELPMCSSQEGYSSPNPDQLEDLTSMQMEDMEEVEEPKKPQYWLSMTGKGKYKRNISLQDGQEKSEKVSKALLDENPNTPTTNRRLHSGARSTDPSIPEEPLTQHLKDNFLHMRQRRNKLFPCSACGKRYTSPGGLLMHQRLHTGEKPFSCSVCGKSFTQKGILISHEKIHQGIKPFSCSLCGKCFAKKSDVVRHMTVHTGEKPHPCDRCGKGFTQRSSLLNHLRLSVCEKPYPCFLCGGRFVQYSELTRHQELHRKKSTTSWSK